MKENVCSYCFRVVRDAEEEAFSSSFTPIVDLVQARPLTKVNIDAIQ